MRILHLLRLFPFISIISTSILNAQISVDGTVTLEGQTDHQNISIEFKQQAPNNNIYTTVTDISGQFNVSIELGYYDIFFTKDGFHADSLKNVELVSSQTLSALQLLEIIIPTNQTYFVPDDFPRIQDAINASIPGDSIIVRNGTYNENIRINRSRLFVSSLFVYSKDTNDINNTIIDAQGSSTVVNIVSDSVEVCGLSVTEGSIGIWLNSSNCNIHNNKVYSIHSSDCGGCAAIRVGGNNHELYNLNVFNNRKFNDTYDESNLGGSALYIYSSNLTVKNSNFFNNNDITFGGGPVFIEGGSSIFFDSCSFSGNYSERHGGAIRTMPHIQVSNSTFKNNYAKDLGGAVQGSGKYINCIFEGNRARLGGAFYGIGRFSNCTFTYNRALAYGAIAYYADCDSCLFYKNSAIESVGAIGTQGVYNNSIFYANNAPNIGCISSFSNGLEINSCTIIGNRSDSGGSVNNSAILSLNNSIVAYNIGGGIQNSSPTNFDLAVNYSNIYNPGYDNFQNSPAYFGLNIQQNNNDDSCDYYFNISQEPLFTDTLQGIYTLQPASPSIDAGIPDSIDADGTVFDQGAFAFDHSKPYVNFSFTVNTDCVPFDVEFWDESVPMNPVDTISEWYWNFGNGLDALSKNATTLYNERDNYTVALSITDAAGNSNQITKKIDLSTGIAILKQSEDTTVFEEDTLNLFVTAVGPGLTYQWFKNGIELSGEVDSVLVMNRIVLQDSGVYSLRITNICNEVLVSDSMLVKVLYKHDTDPLDTVLYAVMQSGEKLAISKLDPYTTDIVRTFAHKTMVWEDPVFLAYDGKYIYLSSSGDDVLYRYNREGEVIDGQGPGTYNITGLAHDGTTLYLLKSTRMLKYQYSNSRLIYLGYVSWGENNTGLSFGGNRTTVFIGSSEDTGARIFELDSIGGSILHKIELGNAFIKGLTYSNGAGILYVNTRDNGLLLLDPNTGEVINSFLNTNLSLAADERLLPGDLPVFPSSTNDILAENAGILVYPNPTNELLVVQISERVSQSYFCTILNSLGEIEYSAELDVAGGRSEIEVSQLPQGFYVAEIFAPNGNRKSFKFIKQP